MSFTGMEIAVVGMSCRFPKSRNIWEFWEHLRAGDELVTHFSEEDLRTIGVDPKMKSDPGYVPAEAIIEQSGHFDAAFFKIAESDAQTMDPQQRLLLECAWHALEDGGYAPNEKSMNCGVFVSGGNNKYYLQNVLPNPDKIEEVGEFQIEIGNSVNFLATRISYLFNLTGPASVVQTACSSSLVGIHYACQSLLNGECDFALSGGSKVEVPQNYGHFYTEGGVKSREGHCRVFDKAASGFVNGNGCGMVLLKRLEDAIKDGDQIYGMVKGSALNNDGSEKIGYTAPSILGQKEVIEEALEIAEVPPESISYIEAHGTGTKLGDPIEIDGLKHVFTATEKHCALGSVKANMGHLDAAAGVAGFIKAILVLYHREYCPQINFNDLNPAINLEDSPFYIPKERISEIKDDVVLRAGVSSFGIGGTNAHLVLEQAPKIETPKAKAPNNYQIITNSAKTKQSLLINQGELADWMENGGAIDQLAISTWKNKPQFRFRTAVVAKKADELIAQLRESEAPTKALDNPKIYFLYPGQGSQYTNMSRELYEQNPTYKEHLDHCLNTLKELSSTDFRSILFNEEDENRIHETQYAQPLIFAVEYALTKVLSALGIVPDAMIGHSLGEITAACIAGIISLPEALELVLIRSRLMQRMPRGSMVSISFNGDRQLLEDLPPELSLAAINSASNYVISGDTSAVALLEENLQSKNIKHRRLNTSHAYHSQMMQGMLDSFESQIQSFNYSDPKTPVVSNLTGDWLQPSAISAEYWKRHVEKPVRFYDGIQLLDEENAIFVEVGPGSALSYLTGQTLSDRALVNLMPSGPQEPSPLQYFNKGFAKIWEYGAAIDLGKLMELEKPQVRIPGYSFDHKNHWLELGQSTLSAPQPKEQLTYAPYWKQINFEQSNKESGKICLFLISATGKQFMQELATAYDQLIVVKPGKRFKEHKGNFEMNVGDPSHYDQLFSNLKSSNRLPSHIIHGLSITAKAPETSIQNVDGALKEWYYSLLDLIRALNPYLKNGISLDVLTNNAFSVLGNERTNPIKATLTAPVKIAPLEYEGLQARLIEFDQEDWKRDEKAVTAHLIRMIRSNHQPGMKSVALRGNRFWEQDYQTLTTTKTLPPLRKEGVYLITGGFGGMGRTIGQFLAENYQAKLALFTSSRIPPKDQWQSLTNEKAKIKVEHLNAINTLGGSVKAFAVDVADHQAMKKATQDILKTWGTIHGIIHTAGRADFGGILSKRTHESIHEIIAPKIHGHLTLRALTAQLPLDFFVNFSSIGNQVYGKKFGQIAYNTANEYLDACASNDGFEKTINWCDWLDVGMAFDAVKQKSKLQEAQQVNARVLHGILPQQGIDLFQKALASPEPQMLISPVDFPTFISTSNTTAVVDLMPQEMAEGYSQALLTEKLSQIYQSFFGLEQLNVNADFDALGGDSLKAVVLLSRIKKKLKLPLSLSEFYEHSSVSTLASFLSEEDPLELSPLQTEYFLIPSGKNLIFGTWYTSKTADQAPIILCPPLFQEEIIADRAMTTLCERIATSQSPVVRFDFAGMGNSEGDQSTLSLEDWHQNLKDVIQKTKDKFTSNEVHLIGLRLGATLIHSFLPKYEGTIGKVLYWHPVLNGNDYLKSLVHDQQLLVKGSLADPSALPGKKEFLEFNSYQISRTLKSRLEGLSLELATIEKGITVIHAEHKKVSLQSISSKNLILSNGPAFWNKLATEKGYVPEDEIQEIVKWRQTLKT